VEKRRFEYFTSIWRLTDIFGTKQLESVGYRMALLMWS